MKELLKKLANLADQLDLIDAKDMADEVDTLINELPLKVKEPSLIDETARRAKEQSKMYGICKDCGGSGVGVDAPWCEACGGTGKGDYIPSSLEIDDVIEPTEIGLDKVSYIRHQDGKWNVYSRKGKRLGSYKTKAQAQKRLRQIEFWKHKG
jgi:hypothetical protein